MNIMPKPNSNFTVIQNDIFDNYPDMSAKSKFMLLQVLSKPANWKLNLAWLAKQNNEGIHAVKSAVKEWERNGFLHRFTARADGRIKEVVPVVCYPPLTRKQAKAHCNEKYQQDQNRREVKSDVINETVADEKETCRQEINYQENNDQKTAPILNTNVNKNVIKQIPRETTTTTPNSEPGNFDQAMPLPPSCSANEILNLIPEKHRSPMVLTFVNKAMVDYPAKEVEQAVAYAACNVRGGSMQFKAYLDKTLKNKWAEGYLESMEGPCQHESPWAPEGQFQPGGRFQNGFVTGSRRMDANLAACLEFAAYCEGKKEVTA